MSSDEIVQHELSRINNKLETVLEVQAEQGKTLVLHSQSLSLLAQKQVELQDAQKEMVTAMQRLSDSTLKIQHNCDTRRDTYTTLSSDMYGENGLIRKYHTLELQVSSLSKLFWWAITAVGAIASAVSGMAVKLFSKG